MSESQGRTTRGPLSPLLFNVALQKGFKGAGVDDRENNYTIIIKISLRIIIIVQLQSYIM